MTITLVNPSVLPTSICHLAQAGPRKRARCPRYYQACFKFNHRRASYLVIVLSDGVDNFAVLYKGCLTAGLYIHLGLVNPACLKLDDLIVPDRVIKHVTNLLRIRNPVYHSSIIGGHVPARGTPAFELVQVVLEMLLESIRCEILVCDKL